MEFFSKTSFDDQQQKTFKPYYTIKDGVENVFRIAPACRSLSERGDYAAYLSNHFGHKVQDNRNPDKMRIKVFSCIKKIDFKTKQVLQPCPECDWIERELKTLEDEKDRLKAEGRSDEFIRNATSQQAQWLKEHNLDKKWYCYAKNRNGEWNIFKFGHKVKLQLDEIMKRAFKTDGINALDPASGVWFRFTPNGLKGAKAITNVEIYKESVMVNGRKYEEAPAAPLSEDDVKQIQALPDIMSMTPKLTFDQINSMVNAKGDPSVVSSVFALGVRTSREASPATSSSTFQELVSQKPQQITHRMMDFAPPSSSAEKRSTMTEEDFLKSYAK